MTTAPGMELALRQEFLTWRYGLLNTVWLLTMHATVFAALWFAPPAVAIMVCVIHQRLLSEWFHEATHWNLLPDRRWNDRLADLLIGPFNGTRVQSNRPAHFQHHAAREYFGPEDPDTAKAAATTRRELRQGLFRDLTGQTALSAFTRAAGMSATGTSAAGPGAAGKNRATGEWRWLGALAVLHGVGFAASVAVGRWELYPLYFGSLLTLYPVANRLRLYAQHAEVGPDGTVHLNGSTASRTCHAGLLEQVLLHGPMIMYHHEHHARPVLPYRALRGLALQSAAQAPDPNVTVRSGWQLTAGLLRSLR